MKKLTDAQLTQTGGLISIPYGKEILLVGVGIGLGVAGLYAYQRSQDSSKMPLTDKLRNKVDEISHYLGDKVDHLPSVTEKLTDIKNMLLSKK